MNKQWKELVTNPSENWRDVWNI